VGRAAVYRLHVRAVLHAPAVKGVMAA
jgi:hypothetical protein